LDPTKKTPVFFKAHLTKKSNPQEISRFTFPVEMYYEVKSKISSTLVQLAVHFFNETKRTATKFEGLEKKRRII